MAAFPTAGHLASWAGMCPGQRDSAGRPGSGKTRKGSTWVTRSPGPVRQRGLTHQGHLLSERYRQVVRRRSDAKAIVRSGHQILLAAYRVLVPAQPYKDPAPTTLSRPTAQRPVSYTHLRAHETRHDLVCRLLLEKKKNKKQTNE